MVCIHYVLGIVTNAGYKPNEWNKKDAVLNEFTVYIYNLATLSIVHDTTALASSFFLI